MSTRKKYLGRSELARIGKWRANLKGRKFWTETDEEILQIILELNERLEKIQSVVNKQAEDEVLWCDADSIVEAYVQQELRKLHKIIEESVA